MDSAPELENRLRIFASFFKGYMGVMPLVTAAVAPLLTMMKAIPIFEAQKSVLATYSALLGFLLLAWVFYMRGALANAMLPPKVYLAKASYPEAKPDLKRYAANLLPLLLILGSAACFMAYLAYLNKAVDYLSTVESFKLPFKLVLEKGQYPIPYQTTLMALYLGIFLCAEVAFVLMALREYAYGVLKVPEVEILGEPVRLKHSLSSSTMPSKPPKKD